MHAYNHESENEPARSLCPSPGDETLTGTPRSRRAGDLKWRNVGANKLPAHLAPRATLRPAAKPSYEECSLPFTELVKRGFSRPRIVRTNEGSLSFVSNHVECCLQAY